MGDENIKEENSLAVRWLGAGEVRASWKPEAASLTLTIDKEEVSDARAALAFPVSHPGRYIDLSNSKSESIGMLKALVDLDEDSRKAIETCLESRYLIPRITRVIDITDPSPFVLRWDVETSKGRQVFFSESPREAIDYKGPGRFRITDLTGNHYDVTSVAELDAIGRAKLESYL